MNTCTRLTVPLITVLAMAGSLLAQDDYSVQLDTTSPIITQASNPRLKSPITLWAKDASLSEVLKVLSERSGMNFVADEGVQVEKITIILSKTPLDEAINLLVRASGLSYEIIGNSVLIAEPAKLKDEVGQSGYVVALKYANANEVATMLSDLTTNIKVDQGGNRLVCFTSPRVILEIEKIVKAIDNPHILVMLETRLIEVSMDNLGQYGIDWGALSPVAGGVAYGGRSQSAGATGGSVQLDPIQIAKGAARGNWWQMPMNFNLVLDALIANGDARLLMNSKLSTTNNRQASLHIGDVVPYTIQSYNLSASGGVNQQIEKEEVGVKVTMTPHVNDENDITLDLLPEVSSIIGWKGPAADIPLVRVRKALTTIRVKDGQTVFLAGLLSEEKSTEIRKLPLLGQIPLLGLLFQHKREEVRKTNLIIEVTPKIIRTSADFTYAPGDDTSK